MKKFPIIYKWTEKGAKQQWQIFAKDDTFYTIEGIVGGKLTTSKPTICIGKNIGKKNETSPIEQAILEATAKHTKKLERGYALKIEDSGKKYFQPMLAEPGKDKETKKVYEWAKELFEALERKEIRMFVQPKLDGIRCINSNGVLTSREGKFFVSCPHLHQSGVILDGELYNHDLKEDFNAIVSLIKQPKATAEDLARSKQFAQMWVYDMPSVQEVFSKRYAELENWFATNTNNSFVLTPTYEIFSEKEMKVWHKKFVKDGFEGTMIRTDSVYENKRTKMLMKWKDFIDEEFIIVDAVEGKGGRIGTIGKFILQHDKNPEQTWKCDVKGEHPYLKEIWENRNFYIGKEATVQYQNRTPKKSDGGDVPRFAKIIKLDRKSYE